METVTIKDVEHKATGWYDIRLEDGRKASTKDKKVADAAHAAMGLSVGAEIGHKQKDGYDNYYLNKIVLNDTPNGVMLPEQGASVKDQVQESLESVAAKAATKIPTQDERGERIARQWAYGRAVEIATAFGALAFPLDDDSVAKLKITAETLLELSK